MIDREKVIKGLDVCLKNIDQPDCPNDCPYLSDCSKYENRVVFQPLMRDALALIKEQKHGETFTVIDTKTGKEADEYEIALHEDWAKGLCYCDMDGWAIMDDGTLLLVDECGRCAYADRERFKVKWE